MSRLLFALGVGAMYGLLMMLLRAFWPVVAFVALCFGLLGWAALPSYRGKKGGCLE